MNLLESFSQTTGIKPEKTTVYEKFFPLDFSDFIILATQAEDKQHDYVFWDRVIELISPTLQQNNIKIIQFARDKKHEGCDAVIDVGVSLNEKTYLMKKAKLFCGSSALFSLICSEYAIPQVFLKSDYSVDNTVVSKEDTIHSDQKRKGFLNPLGNSVNNIRPEEVAQAIMFKIFPEVDFNPRKTLYIGKIHSIESIDLIPDCYFTPPIKNFADHIIIRLDRHFDLKNAEKQLQITKSSIVTNRPIGRKFLEKYQKNINKVFIKIIKNSDVHFLQLLEDLKIKFDLMTDLEGKSLANEKIKYLDYPRINMLNKVDLSFLDEVDVSKVKFKTNKVIIKSGKLYPCSTYMNQGKDFKKIKKIEFDLPSILDDTFRQEADNFYFSTSENI